MLNKYFVIILKTSLFVISFSLLVISYSSPAHAVDLTPYFFPTSANGVNISSGEYFRVVDEGNGFYKIYKSRDPKYYERFKIENGTIYHITETPWAAWDGPVRCSDNGAQANLGYKGGALAWAPVNMQPNTPFESEGYVQGVENGTNRECPTSINGPTGKRKFTLIHQGCVQFPTGVTSDDAIVMEIPEGPGKGEQFYYDKNKGWIGFNRGSNGTGNYVTDQLSNKTYAPGACYQVPFSTGSGSTGSSIINPSLCPAGFTCPDSAAKPIPGEKIHYEADVYSMPSGKTGPDKGQLNVPNLDDENGYYSQREILDRSLPANLVDKLMFNPIVFDAHIAHPGCGDIYINGGSQGRAELEKSTSQFNTTEGYNNLFLVTNYLQTLLIPNMPSTLQYTATQPSIPEAPTNLGGCTSDQGFSFQPVQIPNPEPGVTGFFESLRNRIGDFFKYLACGVVGKACTVHVALDIQQLKEIPGEKQFEKQTIGDGEQAEGFLGFYKPMGVPYPKDGDLKDENDKSTYKVFEQTRPVGAEDQVGVTYEGMSAFQSGTCGLIDSLYPVSIQTNCLEAATVVTTPITPPTNAPTEVTELLKVPYRDASITLNSDTKARIISQIKSVYPDSKIDQYWDLVVSTATQKGINPAFALTVWIEESMASSPAVAAKYGVKSSWGCDPKVEQTVEQSLNCFVNTTLNSPKTPDFSQWAQNYCGRPAPGAEVCTTNEAGEDNSGFLFRINYWYNQFAQQKINGVN